MEMHGEYRIAASRERVWDALNDPEILKASIPGCEELEKVSDTEYTAKVRAKVGPVSARFSGKVQMHDLDPPNGYRIEGEGTGGAAGFAKGGAVVSLDEEGDTTVLRYEVTANVGGKLAQIGSRLIQGTAKKMADDFFKNFSEQAGAPLEGAADVSDGAESANSQPEQNQQAQQTPPGDRPAHEGEPADRPPGEAERRVGEQPGDPAAPPPMGDRTTRTDEPLPDGPATTPTPETIAAAEQRPQPRDAALGGGAAAKPFNTKLIIGAAVVAAVVVVLWLAV